MTRPRPSTVVVRPLRLPDMSTVIDAVGPELADRYPAGDQWLAGRLCDALTATGPGTVDASVAVTPDGRVVGLLIAQLKGHRVKLSCLWVATGHRHTGVGRTLLEHAVAAFGARDLYLTCDQDLADGFGALLTPAGFTVTATLPGRYRPGHTELVWVRPADVDYPIRALSLTRPWGDLILTAGKNVENRSRRTSHRGILVVHGAKSTTRLAEHFCNARDLPADPDDPTLSPTGYLGIVHLVGLCHDSDCDSTCSPWAMDDSWHWKVAFAVPFPAPLPGRGNVSLWTPDDTVTTAVRAALSPAATA